MNRQAQGMLLFVVGGAVLRASSTDLYLRYVKTGLRPLLLAAGVVLIAAAIATLWHELRPTRTAGTNRPDHEHSDGHGHSHREPRIAWLLVLPVFALILVGPPALGSYTATRTGTALQKPLGFAALPAGDPVQLSLLDYAGRAVYDTNHTLGGRRVEITGFITVDPGGTPYLTRMILNCCAADAQPIKVGMSGQLPPALQPDTWFEVIGTYTSRQLRDSVNNGPIPFINVSQARAVPVPHEQYES